MPRSVFNLHFFQTLSAELTKEYYQRDMETMDQEMDAELGLGVNRLISGRSRATAIHLEFDEDVTMKDSNFNIKRNIRYTKKVEQASVEDGDLVSIYSASYSLSSVDLTGFL